MGVNRDFDVLYKEMSLRKHDLHPLALNWRAKGGRKYTKSSPNAHKALLKGQLFFGKDLKQNMIQRQRSVLGIHQSTCLH